MTLSWTQAQCEACWIDTEGEWEDVGDDTSVLTGCRMPTVMIASERQVEQCAWCGNPTIMGIYKRVDPTTVPYPKEKDE